MKIDGKQLADTILSGLRTDVEVLKAGGTIPTLAVILVGNNTSSISYINQKKLAAESIGAILKLTHLPDSTTPDDLRQVISGLNSDPGIHGIIIQRPLPHTTEEFRRVLSSVSPHKDVDGFVHGTSYPVPVALAVEHILRYVWEQEKTDATEFFTSWLENKKIIVAGRGETAGKPIAQHLKGLSIHPEVIHSQTANAALILKESDIVIACVGKPGFITHKDIKKGAILISVGIIRDQAGRLRGDYDEKDISSTASYYTPTPSGVGPVNVACLMENLLKASRVV